MILLIDNYDSFSYNLYQLIGKINPDIRVIRNDEMTPEQMEALQPQMLVVSPGPGKPSEAGYCKEAIRFFTGKIPIVGVCLGHQAICEAFGGTITYAKQLMHGKTSKLQITDDSVIFKGLEQGIEVARYHSLAAEAATLPKEFRVTATTQDGEIMAIEHREYPVYGLQFHPESVLTKQGKQIMSNLIEKKEEE